MSSKSLPKVLDDDDNAIIQNDITMFDNRADLQHEFRRHSSASADLNSASASSRKLHHPHNNNKPHLGKLFRPTTRRTSTRSNHHHDGNTNTNTINNGASARSGKRRPSYKINLAKVTAVFKINNWGRSSVVADRSQSEPAVRSNNNYNTNSSPSNAPTTETETHRPRFWSVDRADSDPTAKAQDPPQPPQLQSSLKGGKQRGGFKGKGRAKKLQVSLATNTASLSSSLTGNMYSNMDSKDRLRQRRMSRRARRTFRGEMKLADPGRRSTAEYIEESLTSVLMMSLGKKGLCDVELVGNDDVPVGVPSYLLAAHSEVFERMLRSKPAIGSSESTTTADVDVDVDSEADTEHAGAGANTEPSTTSTPPRQFHLPFADYDAIELSVHFLINRSLPEVFEKDDANEFNLRSVCRIYLFGRLFKIHSLMNRASSVARRMMNNKPKLVCAAFDECVVGALALEGCGDHLRTSVVQQHDELKLYALEYLRDTPMTTLLAGGTIYLNKDSIEAIICDQDMDVDEHTMFHILNTWVKQDYEENLEAGRELVSHIDLSLMKTEYLNNAVRKCGFVESANVQQALKEIEEMIANQSPDEKEHVLVGGAGNYQINGIYVRMDEDIGLGAGEVMYIKEAPEDDYDTPDYGLYLLRSTWAITPCVDYSNTLYSCEITDENSDELRHQTPKTGWKAASGPEPAPSCMWNPGKESAAEGGGKGYVAPNLAGEAKKSICDMANGDHDEGARKRYTLRTMLNLPTDEDFEDNDYHDDIKDDSARSGSNC